MIKNASSYIEQGYEKLKNMVIVGNHIKKHSKSIYNFKSKKFENICKLTLCIQAIATASKKSRRNLVDQ